MREGARQPDRAHRRLRARGDEAHELDGRHGVDDLCRELHLGLGRCAEGRAALGSLADRRERLGIGMTEDERPPGHHPVDVAPAVDVLDQRTLAARA